MSPQSRTLTVVSDTICPWCYVGKRRLDAALPILADEGLSLDVQWQAFQLIPDMPDEGLDRVEYRAAKFGGTEASQALDVRVSEAAADAGIGFRFDRIRRTPNTLASHVLIADARRAGGALMQNRVVEALFAAYFVEGRDIGRAEILREIAMMAGFEHGPSVSAELWELVEQEELSARQSGIGGVPTFLLDGHYLFSGAQPTDVIVLGLRRAAATLAEMEAALVPSEAL